MSSRVKGRNKGIQADLSGIQMLRQLLSSDMVSGAERRATASIRAHANVEGSCVTLGQTVRRIVSGHSG